MEHKIVPNFPAYTVSSCGTEVISLKTGQQIKQSVQMIKGKSTGYLYCTLLWEGFSLNTERWEYLFPAKRVAVHRLVALTWLGQPPEGKPWVNHKDGNKQNNHVNNLEWTSISENIQHKFDSGLYVTPKGSEHWKYGKPVSKETRRKQSVAKQGEKHPKFAGWWVVNGKKYASTYEAAKDLGTYPKKIYADCKAKRNLCYFLPKDFTGKCK